MNNNKFAQVWSSDIITLFTEGEVYMVECFQLSITNGQDEYNMLQDIGKVENGFTNEVKGMSFDDYKLWLVQQDNYSKGENVPVDWIPQTTYFLYSNKTPVGVGRIRHYSLNTEAVFSCDVGMLKPDLKYLSMH